MTRLSRNILYNVMGQGLVLILGFVAVKYVFSNLGVEAFGIIYFALMLSTMLSSVLAGGLAQATVREVSRRVDQDPVYVQELIRTASLFYWGAYVFFVGILFFSAPWIAAKWIALETMDVSTATFMIRLLGVGAMIALPNSLYASLFRGLQKMQYNNLVEVVVNALRQFGIALILTMGGDLLHVVYWIVASFGLGTILHLLFLHRFFTWRAFLPGYHPSVVKRNVAYVYQMMVISLLALVHRKADKLIVSILLPIGLFGIYAFAYNAISKTQFLATAVTRAAFPSLSRLFEAGEEKTLKRQHQNLHELLCVGIVPFFAAVPFAAMPVFGEIFNPGVAKLILLPSIFLALGFYMNVTLTIPYSFSLAVGRPDIAARSNLYALFIVLPATVALTRFFGLAGASFAWVFYHLFMYTYAVPRMCSECLEIPMRTWFGHIVRIMALGIATYGLAWFLGGGNVRFSNWIPCHILSCRLSRFCNWRLFNDEPRTPGRLVGVPFAGCGNGEDAENSMTAAYLSTVLLFSRYS